MKSFAEAATLAVERREAEHGGLGPIAFRRLMDRNEFSSSLDFVDLTVIPPGSTIGRHLHQGSEELYFVVSGTPFINVNGRGARAAPGTLAVVRSGEWHELINDSQDEVTILVVQASVGDSP